MAMELTQNEEELVRRLGLAVKNQWGGVPPFAQDQILAEACVD